MEYIRGITLDLLLKRNGRLSPARAGRLLGQLCEALQAAHGQNIIHRDLKPANVMVVDGDTPYEKIKVMDFGLAKLLDFNPLRFTKASDTGADFAVGTPGYISPEQIRGDEMDHRSDLYSVGVILFELLCGRLPFTGEQTMDVMLAHATEPPPTFESIGAAAWVTPAIEAVVQRCLSKSPGDRPASARDLAEQYESALLTEQEQPSVQPAAVVVEDSKTAAEPASTAARHVDPYEVVHEMEAWMPETIASFKLRGFVQDVGGEVVESSPGLIRVRLGGKGSVYHVSPGPLSWLGLGKQVGLVNMDLHLERSSGQLQDRLRITVRLHPPDKNIATNPTWRARASRIFCDLRAYLAGDAVAEST
jgi:serine/threonine-protein kinase